MDNSLNDGNNGQFDSVIDKLKECSAEDIIFPNYLPNRDVIIDIVGIIRNILFPGYFEKLKPEAEASGYNFDALLADVYERLRGQICRALMHESPVSGICDEDADSRSSQITREFIQKIPELRRILITDVEAALDGDPAASSKHEIIFAYPGIYTISVYRIAHELHLLDVPLIPRIMTEHAHSVTGIDIHPGAQIGHHFFIDHGTGVVIGETTTIGNYVKLYQGVTLGALSTRGGRSLRGKKRHPTLEDEVTVYSSTSILGGDTVIGKGAVIGSNAFITRSVPAGMRVSIKTPELDMRDLSSRNEK